MLSLTSCLCIYSWEGAIFHISPTMIPLQNGISDIKHGPNLPSKPSTKYETVNGRATQVVLFEQFLQHLLKFQCFLAITIPYFPQQ